ncbi:MAG: DUF1491 family protein [Rhodospirillales bacterium]|nr:DUF1491 family protein [Rhodospirillales bacterium]
MERVKSGLRIQALLWRLDRQAVAAVIRKKGDADSGSILLKLSYLDGTASVLSQVQDGGGESVWMRATGLEPVAEDKAEAYIARSLKIDSDLWVVEIEDPRRQFRPDGKLL